MGTPQLWVRTRETNQDGRAGSRKRSKAAPVEAAWTSLSIMSTAQSSPDQSCGRYSPSAVQQHVSPAHRDEHRHRRHGLRTPARAASAYAAPHIVPSARWVALFRRRRAAGVPGASRKTFSAKSAGVAVRASGDRHLDELLEGGHDDRARDAREGAPSQHVRCRRALTHLRGQSRRGGSGLRVRPPRADEETHRDAQHA